MLRRHFLLAATLSAVGLTNANAQTQTSCAQREKPEIPTDWCAEEMYEELAAKGLGVHYPGPANRPVAYIAFDTQCPWCIRLMDQTYLLREKIDFVWIPVAVLNTRSEPQGAAILAAVNPVEMLERHHSQFNRKDSRGLDTANMAIPLEKREAVWTNTKIFRRSGAMVVPFGVMKDKKGEYHAILSTMKTADLEKLFR